MTHSLRSTTSTCLAAWGLCVAAAAATTGPDRVTIETRQGARAGLTGQIVDFTGQSLRIILPGQPGEIIPAERVLAVETTYLPAHVEADAARAAGRFEQARVLYGRAIQDEKRRWVRRRMLVGMVWCDRSLGRVVEAAETALVLVGDEPGAADWACLPLAWQPGQPTPKVEQAARRWLDAGESPATVLLGASHLLGVDRLAALARLKGLVIQADGPVASLAQAQIWRTEIVGSDAEKLAAWQRAIDRMDAPLRPGPYFVLGQALARRQDWEGAALALLHVPIFQPEDRPLAAEALWGAARSLEELGRGPQARTLYREIAARFPDTSPAAEAQQRLKPGGAEGQE